MTKEIITKNRKETVDLGKSFASKLSGGEIVCLYGDLGTGKTSFSQGVLQGLGAKGPYTSPTFVIMKEYKILNDKNIENVYHIDAYRIGGDDMMDLGWKELVEYGKNIVIIEWAEKIKEIIPQKSKKIEFLYISENKRKIIFK